MSPFRRNSKRRGGRPLSLRQAWCCPAVIRRWEACQKSPASGFADAGLFQLGDNLWCHNLLVLITCFFNHLVLFVLHNPVLIKEALRPYAVLNGSATIFSGSLFNILIQQFHYLLNLLRITRTPSKSLNTMLWIDFSSSMSMEPVVNHLFL